MITLILAMVGFLLLTIGITVGCLALTSTKCKKCLYNKSHKRCDNE